MKPRVFCARFVASPLALAAAFAAHSQTPLPLAAPTLPPLQLKEVVVTATRTPQRLVDVVADVTVIDRDTIERAGPVGLADVLARVPGFQIARNGGIGNSSSVFVRGGENRHTPVLVDGVRVESQNTSGGANWSSIPLSQIERIEIVRGPTSAVYGSDAVAGMIQIFTLKGQGAFTPSVTLGYGSYRTRHTEAAASGTVGAWDYFAGITEENSRGFNVRPIAGENPDADGYKRRSVHAKFGLRINPDHRLEASVLQNHMDAQYDSGPMGDYRSIADVQTLGLHWLAQWTPAYSTRVSVTQGTDGNQDGPNGASTTIDHNKSRMRTLLVQNDYKLGAQLLTALYEHRQDKFLLASVWSDPIRRERSLDSVGLGYGWTGGPHTVQLNLRHDKDSEFGSKTTGSAAYALALNPAWKLSASAGTSFRVPTLYQRFSEYGSPDLQVENGKNVEIGLKYAQGTAQFGVTAYRNRMTDLLTYVSGEGPCSNGGPPVPSSWQGCYANTARVLYQGLTFSARQALGPVQVYGSLDVQNPRNQITQRELQLRSRRFATLGADGHVGNWSLAADVLMTSKRRSSDTGSIYLPGYTLLNFSASTPVARDWKFLVKVDNLTDKVYQTALDYASPRRSLYVALSWAPQ